MSTEQTPSPAPVHHVVRFQTFNREMTMPATVMNKRNAVVCDCSECGTLVEITPFNGFDPNTEDTDAEWVCADCGKIVCESCHQDFNDVIYGDAEDPGGADEQKVCSDCFAKIQRRLSAIAPEGT